MKSTFKTCNDIHSLHPVDILLRKFVRFKVWEFVVVCQLIMSQKVWLLLSQLQGSLCLDGLDSGNQFRSEVILSFWNVSFLTILFSPNQDVIFSAIFVSFVSWLCTPVGKLSTVTALIIPITVNINLYVAWFFSIYEIHLDWFLIILLLSFGFTYLFGLRESKMKMCTSEVSNDLIRNYFAWICP